MIRNSDGRGNSEVGSERVCHAWCLIAERLCSCSLKHSFCNCSAKVKKSKAVNSTTAGMPLKGMSLNDYATGQIMGKMVDAQSIVVASTATNWYGHEGDILRYVFFHSIALAALMGILVYLQAYVAPFTATVVK